MKRGGATILLILGAVLVGKLLPDEKQRTVPIAAPTVVEEQVLAAPPVLKPAKEKKVVLTPVLVPIAPKERVVPTDILFVSATKLNVRDGPSATATKTGQLTKNAMVSVLRTSGDFVYIVSEGNKAKGWVNRSFLSGNKPIVTRQAIAVPPRKVIAPVELVPAQKLKPVRTTGFTHSGNCSCPYDTDSIGRRCGKRSAYSRAGGASPTCNGRNVFALEAPALRVAPTYSGTCGGTGYGSVSCITGAPKTTYVRGYRRKNGTYVRPHYRSRRR